MPKLDALERANQRRNKAGAAQQVAKAREARRVLVSLPDGLPTSRCNHRIKRALPRYTAVVDLRIKHPKATLAELAEMSGMTKPAYWRALSRALRLAERVAA